MKKKLIILLAIIPLFASAQFPKSIAHRGGALLAPENTLAAFNKAVEVKADYYELDVQISKDDSLVIIHDASVDRTTDGTGNITGLTYEQLHALDAGSWFGAEFAGEKIPTLREALTVALDPITEIGIVIELKSSEGTLAAKTVEVIQAMGLQGRVIVSSFSLSQITQVKTLDPTIAVQLFAAVTTSHIDQVAAINGEWVGSSGPFTQEIVDYAHSKGIKFNVWTINSAIQMLPLFALGVDGITTDNPVEMIEAMDESEPGDVVLLSASVAESEIVLTWEEAIDSESGIVSYSVYRDENPGATTLLATVGPVTQYTDISIVESSQYYYRVKAMNKAGLSSLNFSNEISANTLSDLIKPEIKYVTSKGNNKSVILEFSEKLLKSDAENVSNYTLNNDATIVNARLARDQKSVILTTSALEERLYLLRVENLSDLAAIPNTISPVNIVFEYKAYPEGLVALYDLDTLVAIDPDILVEDATENLNHGKVINGTFISAGYLGNAIELDGTDDFVQFAASPSFDIGTSAVSISLWTKMDYLPTELPGAFGPVFDSEGDQYVIYADRANSELRFKVSTSGGAERPGINESDLVTGEWIHIAGVYDGSKAMIYLNGVLKDSHPLSGTVKTGQVATLGKSGTTYYSGSIDQVEVYNIALTEDEIIDRYNFKEEPVDMYPLTAAKPSAKKGFGIYPNPNSGLFSLEIYSDSRENSRFEVLNALGKVIYREEIGNKTKSTIQIPSAPAGLYFVRISDSKEFYMQKMIIK